jgi:hypothetical protein
LALRRREKTLEKDFEKDMTPDLIAKRPGFDLPYRNLRIPLK